MFFFFFFQAEDGIRDLIVTGVQTCALPIFSRAATRPSHSSPRARSRSPSCTVVAPRRSEERRVGKECRSGWSRYHSKKKRVGDVAARRVFHREKARADSCVGPLVG